jgi:hypothetical protein
MVEETLINWIQTRMDKCTSEQFWAVAAITGLNYFLVSQSSIIQKSELHNYVIVALVLLSPYGIYFVVHRHVSWFRLECELRKLLKDKTIAPKMLTKEIHWWSFTCLSGVLFYTVWILVVTCAGVVSC